MKCKRYVKWWKKTAQISGHRTQRFPLIRARAHTHTRVGYHEETFRTANIKHGVRVKCSSNTRLRLKFRSSRGVFQPHAQYPRTGTQWCCTFAITETVRSKLGVSAKSYPDRRGSPARDAHRLHNVSNVLRTDSWRTSSVPVSGVRTSYAITRRPTRLYAMRSRPYSRIASEPSAGDRT